jgi:hypothetical protein
VKCTKSKLGKQRRAKNKENTAKNIYLNYKIRVGDGEATLAKSFDFPFYPYIS